MKNFYSQTVPLRISYNAPLSPSNLSVMMLDRKEKLSDEAMYDEPPSKNFASPA